MKIDDKYGQINEKGEEVIPVKYNYIEEFTNIYTKAKIGDKWGYINTKGEEITPIKYHVLENFIDGKAFVKIDDKWGCINEAGEEIVPIEYDEIQNFIYGEAKVRKGNKWGYVDLKGNEFVPTKYDEIGAFYDRKAKVKIGDKWGAVNRKGEEVIPVKYEQVDLSIYLDRVKLNNKFGFVDETGKEIIAPTYEDTFFPSERLIAIQQEGKWGLIDFSGNRVLRARFDEIKRNDLGYIEVRKKRKEFFFNEGKGKIVEKPSNSPEINLVLGGSQSNFAFKSPYTGKIIEEKPIGYNAGFMIFPPTGYGGLFTGNLLGIVKANYFKKITETDTYLEKYYNNLVSFEYSLSLGMRVQLFRGVKVFATGGIIVDILLYSNEEYNLYDKLTNKEVNYKVQETFFGKEEDSNNIALGANYGGGIQIGKFTFYIQKELFTPLFKGSAKMTKKSNFVKFGIGFNIN